MYIVFVILIIVASVLMILAVLAQNPKSGMAANFGAGNQVMGVRQTSDFLEKFTWSLAIAIVVFSLAASVAMNAYSRSANGGSDKVLEEFVGSRPTEIPAIPMEVKTDANETATSNIDIATSIDESAAEEAE